MRVLSSLAQARIRGTPGGEREARLEAARGEWESFQVVVHAGSAGLSSLRFAVEALRSPAEARRSVAAIRCDVYRVAFVDLKTPSNIEGEIGPHPDPLIPTIDGFTGERRNGFPISVAAGADAVAWIELFVPQETPPGTYRGAILVEDGARVVARVPVSLGVHRFAIPATSSLPVTFGYSAATAALGHYGRPATEIEASELTRRYALSALRHRISLHGGTMTAPPFTVDPRGQVQLDLRAYDDEVGPFLDGNADPGGPAAGARWTAFDLRVPARFPRSDGDATGGHDDTRASYVQALVDHLAKRGWLSRVFHYAADEPADKELDALRERAAAFKRAAPAVPRMVTHRLVDALVGAVDIWCTPLTLLDGKPGGDPATARSKYLLREAAGERLWWYQSCLSHGCDIVGGRAFTGWPSLAIDAPPVSHRVLEWLSFRYRVGGELYYNTVEAYAGGDPFRDPLRHGGNGDGTLFYPGRPDRIGGNSHIPVESIRLSRIRDGLEDFEYLRLLEQRAGRGEAERFAGQVARRTFDWEHDPDRLLAVRHAIARRLDELWVDEPPHR